MNLNKARLLNIWRKVLTKVSYTKLIVTTILLVVSLPYIASGLNFVYTLASSRYNDYQAEVYRKERTKNLETTIETVKKENLRRERLLQKYNITQLDKHYPCDISQGIVCPFEIAISDSIIEYLLGEHIDSRYGSDVSCELRDGKNKISLNLGGSKNRLCPVYSPSSSGICFDNSTDYQREKSKDENLSSIARELKETGFYFPEFYSNGKEASYVEYLPLDQCSRMDSKEYVEALRKEMPSVALMIKENPTDSFVQGLSKSYINFTILNP